MNQYAIIIVKGGALYEYRRKNKAAPTRIEMVTA